MLIATPQLMSASTTVLTPSMFRLRISLAFVLQFVGELPVLNSRKLGNDVRTTSGQQIVGRTGYDIDIRKDCHRCLCSNRIRPCTALDRSIGACDSVVACSCW